MNLAKESLLILKKAGLGLFLVFFTYSFLDSFISLRVEEIISSPHGLSNWIWAYGMASILASLLFPTLGTLLCLWAIVQTESDSQKQSWANFAGQFAEQSLIETIRSWGSVLAWSLLLFIPGLIQLVLYTFVPFVVVLDRNYDLGTEDALKRSQQMVRRNWLKVISILIVFHLALPMLLSSSFDAYRLPWKTPLASMGLTFVDLILFCLSTQLLFRIFRKANAEVL